MQFMDRIRRDAFEKSIKMNSIDFRFKEIRGREEYFSCFENFF